MYTIRPSTDPLGEDPLSKVLAPPPGETADERAARLRKEADAKRVNDEIDERIKQERAAWKKQKNRFKLLLLGQSESGSSFILFFTLSHYTCPALHDDVTPSVTVHTDAPCSP